MLMRRICHRGDFKPQLLGVEPALEAGFATAEAGNEGRYVSSRNNSKPFKLMLSDLP